MTPPRPGGVGRTPLLARTDSRARALLLLLVAAIVATGIGTRLAWWQIVERDPLASMAMHQLAQNEEIPAERGEITDATGVLLATSVELQSVFATPPSVEDPESTAALLAPALGVDVDELRDRLTSDDPWVWLKRRVDPTVSDRVREPGPGRDRHAARDEARVSRPGHLAAARPWRPRSSASSTWMALGNTASSPPRTTCWPACPDRSPPRRT